MATTIHENTLKLAALSCIRLAKDHGIAPTLSDEELASIIVESLAEVLRRRGLAEPVKAKATSPHEIGAW